MRNFDERKAEVLRRSEQIKTNKRRRNRMIIAITPVLVCVVALLATAAPQLLNVKAIGDGGMKYSILGIENVKPTPKRQVPQSNTGEYGELGQTVTDTFAQLFGILDARKEFLPESAISSSSATVQSKPGIVLKPETDTIQVPSEWLDDIDSYIELLEICRKKDVSNYYDLRICHLHIIDVKSDGDQTIVNVYAGWEGLWGKQVQYVTAFGDFYELVIENGKTIAIRGKKTAYPRKLNYDCLEEAEQEAGRALSFEEQKAVLEEYYETEFGGIPESMKKIIRQSSREK